MNRIGEVVWETELAGGYTASVVADGRNDGTLSLVSRSGELRSSIPVRLDTPLTQTVLDRFEELARSLHDREEGGR